MIWTKEKCIAELRAIAVDGFVTSKMAERRSSSLPTMAGRHFGSFAEACKAAGVACPSGRQPSVSCSVGGCDRAPRSKHGQFCETHYYRMRRRGTLDLKVPEPLIDHSNGYKLAWAPGHDRTTAGMNGRVYEHRKVFYEAHGEGPFGCHWCGKSVTWDDMHVDHLNDERDDNRVENLVASCPPCNQERGRHKIRATMLDRMSQKLTLNGVTKPLPVWADELGIRSESLKWRLANGWSVERALTTGRGRFGPRQMRG